MGSSSYAPDRRTYRYLGNFNAAEPWAAVDLWCDHCKVRWTGCWDNCMCQLCEDTTAWREEMDWRNEMRRVRISDDGG